MCQRSVKINKKSDNDTIVVTDTLKTLTYHDRFVWINDASNKEIRQEAQRQLSKAKNPKVYYSILLSGISTSGVPISEDVMKKAYLTLKTVFCEYWNIRLPIFNELLHAEEDEQLQLALK
jgi:hypothetical protein